MMKHGYIGEFEVGLTLYCRFSFCKCFSFAFGSQPLHTSKLHRSTWGPFVGSFRVHFKKFHSLEKISTTTGGGGGD